MYHIRLEQFEGPLPLLLSLIEKEKLDITRLALARVAEQYLEYIAGEREVPLPHLSQFLGIASRLILLKSSALLPTLTLAEDEEESIQDLEWRLREYRKFREASLVLERLFLLDTRSFHRESFANVSEIFSPPASLEVSSIREAFERALGNISTPNLFEEQVVEETVTIEEKMAFLEHRLTLSREVAFSEAVSKLTDRIEIVVSFLALLELVRRKTFTVEQHDPFGEIRFRRAEMLV